MDEGTFTVQVMTTCREESESWMLNSWYSNEYAFGQQIDAEDGETTFIPSGCAFNRTTSSDKSSFTDVRRILTPSFTDVGRILTPFLLAKTASVTDCLIEFL